MKSFAWFSDRLPGISSGKSGTSYWTSKWTFLYTTYEYYISSVWCSFSFDQVALLLTIFIQLYYIHVI